MVNIFLADQDERQPCFFADQKQFPADHWSSVILSPAAKTKKVGTSCPRTWWILILCEGKCWRSRKIFAYSYFKDNLLQQKIVSCKIGLFSESWWTDATTTTFQSVDDTLSSISQLAHARRAIAWRRKSKPFKRQSAGIKRQNTMVGCYAVCSRSQIASVVSFRSPSCDFRRG
jgi:hypothetical protein